MIQIDRRNEVQFRRHFLFSRRMTQISNQLENETFTFLYSNCDMIVFLSVFRCCFLLIFTSIQMKQKGILFFCYYFKSKDK